MSLRNTFDNKSNRRLVPDGPKMSSSPEDQKDSGQIEGQTQTSSHGASSSPSPNP